MEPRRQAEHLRHLEVLQEPGKGHSAAGAVDGPARNPDPPIDFGLCRAQQEGLIARRPTER
ncbi:MAG TPA: hypothetical protein VF462_04775 [Micromonosporaceae bacterium]